MEDILNVTRRVLDDCTMESSDDIRVLRGNVTMLESMESEIHWAATHMQQYDNDKKYAVKQVRYHAEYLIAEVRYEQIKHRKESIAYNLCTLTLLALRESKRTLAKHPYFL